MRCTETSSPWRHTKCRNSCRLLRQLHSEIDSLIVDVSLSIQFVNQTLNHSSQKMMIICWWFERQSILRPLVDQSHHLRGNYHGGLTVPMIVELTMFYWTTKAYQNYFSTAMCHIWTCKNPTHPPSHHDSVQSIVLIHSNLKLITANAITIFDSYTNNLEFSRYRI